MWSLFLFATPLNAQWFDVSCGPNLYFPQHEFESTNFSIEPGMGLLLATHFRYAPTRVGFSTGLQYVTTNYTTIQLNLQPASFTKLTNRHLQLPGRIEICITRPGSIDISAGVGALVSFWMNSTLTGRIHNVLDSHTHADNGIPVTSVASVPFKSRRPFDLNNDRRWTAGSSLDITTSWTIRPGCHIFGRIIGQYLTSNTRSPEGGLTFDGPSVSLTGGVRVSLD